MAWLARISRRRFKLQESTAAAAARSGDLGQLQWLRARGCPLEGFGVLRDALHHADLAVAQWLVDEAGCELPVEGGSDYDEEYEQYCDIGFDNPFEELMYSYGPPEASEHLRAGRLGDEHEPGWGSLLEASAASPTGWPRWGGCSSGGRPHCRPDTGPGSRGRLPERAAWR